MILKLGPSDKDMFLVKCVGQLNWIGLIRAENSTEASISVIKEVLDAKDTTFYLGMFILCINVSGIFKRFSLKERKFDRHIFTIFRSSEILADLRQYNISKLHKDQEEHYVNTERTRISSLGEL